MKLKNVNIFELHVEKVVVAVCAAASLVIVWLYVFSGPYVVTIGGEPGVKPVEVEQKVLNQSRLLADQIGPGVRSPLPDMTVPAYTAMFRDQLDRSGSGVAQLDPLSHPGLSAGVTPVGMAAHGSFGVPVPPAPTTVAARSGFGVLLDQPQLIEHFTKAADEGLSPREAAVWGQRVADEYRQVVAEPSPRDFRYVSVSGVYNIQAWYKKLVEDGRSMPEDWRRSAMLLVDVVLEREAMAPQTGQWGSLTVVPPLPGVVAYRDSRDNWPISEAQEAVQYVAGRQQEIARPEFAPITDASEWAEPELVEEKKKEVKPVVSPGQTAAPVAPETQKPPAPAVIPKPSNRPGWFTDKEHGIGAPQGAKPQPAQAASVGSVAANSGDAGDQSRRSAPPADQPASTTGQDQAAGLLKIWAHDLTVQPGQTYRYRLRARLINPLFQRSKLEARQHQQYFNELALESDPSAWSSPVEIDPERRFFLVSGSTVEREVTVEVWRVFNGKPRVHEFRVKPGDIVGSVVAMPTGELTTDVDMSTGVMVVDLMDAPSSKGLGLRTTQMLYLEVDSNKLMERTVEADRESPVRQRLLQQASLETTVVQAAK